MSAKLPIMSKPSQVNRTPSPCRIARTALGLTQAELAEMSGVSLRTIGNLERGKTRPRSVIAFRISRELGVPVGKLFPPENLGK